MSKNKIKGGKADKMSIEDIAKKHDVSIESIKAQIKMGKKIEMEHVDDENLAEEISMDHLDEIPDYYTRLKEMEKEAKKELNLEAKKFMALAGIKEGDKKFLNNESYQENTPKNLIKESMGDIAPGEWAQMHQEQQLSKDESNPLGWKGMDAMPLGVDGMLEGSDKESESESNFIILEFDQEDVELSPDDDELYRLG
jgi:hypothetical protein